MRKIVAIGLGTYVVAHSVFFIYSLAQVPYTRRELSKRELSDGPLVLKDGVLVGKTKITALSKKAMQKLAKSGKHSGDMKNRKAAKSMKSGKTHATLQSIRKPPLLEADFLKNLTEEAKQMTESRDLIYFTVVNGAFERLTLNWLCNIAIFKGSHEMVMIVSTSKKLCDSVQREYGEKMHCLAVSLPGFEEDLDWGEQKYIDFLVIRAQMMKALTEKSVRYVLVETDSTWFRDPLELFLNTTLIDDADIVVPLKGLTHKGDSLAFSPMLVEPTNTSIVLINEITKRVQSNSSLYDQDVLNELCQTQHHGAVCRNFEYKEIADGKWFYLNDKDKSLMQPYIVNNNFYVGLKNKEARQAISGLWFLTRAGHCSTSKVLRARQRLMGIE